MAYKKKLGRWLQDLSAPLRALASDEPNWAQLPLSQFYVASGQYTE